MKVTRFQWFEDGHAQQAMDVGMISPSEFQRFIAFKIYIDLKKEGKNMRDASEIIAEQMKTSPSWVLKAIYFFVKPNTGDLL